MLQEDSMPVFAKSCLGGAVMRNRSTTPQRSNSAPKINYVTHTSSVSDEKRAFSRHSSRHRVRRFENDNLFGRSTLLKLHTEEYGDDVEDPGLFSQVRTAFADMTEECNREALDFYLSCSQLHRKKNKERYKSEAEKSWMNVEKRLRTVVSKSFQNEKFVEFVDSIELLLVFFQVQRAIPPLKYIPENLLGALRAPLRIEDSKLVVPLIESSFNRLLLHATCQYHGLKSVSTTNKSSKGGKDIIVSLRNSNKFVGHGIALTTLVRCREESSVAMLDDYDTDYEFV